MIDMSGSEGRDPFEDYKVINDEPKAYEQRLEDRPQIVVANKMDMPDVKIIYNCLKNKSMMTVWKSLQFQHLQERI